MTDTMLNEFLEKLERIQRIQAVIKSWDYETYQLALKILAPIEKDEDYDC